MLHCKAEDHFRLSHMLDVITIGSATIDVFVRSGRLRTRGNEIRLPLGEKIELEDLVQETGGGGTNTAFTFSIMGYRTAVVTAIGNDDNGHLIKVQLQKQGIGVQHVQTVKGHPTGYSIIMLTKSGERTVLVYRGATGKLSPSGVDVAALKAKWFYVSSLGGNLSMVRKLITRSEKCGARIAWNPGGKEIAQGFRALAPLIKKVDVLILNREEAALLAGKHPKDLSAIIRHIGAHPRKAFIVTDGPNGATVFGREGSYHCPSLTKKRVNTTGAGDAFGSGFIAGLLKKDDLRYALGVAACNAASVIGHMGAKTGILKTCPLPASITNLPIRPWK